MEKRTKVLVVDDNYMNNDMLCEFVRRYSDLELCASASNGLEALKLIRDKHPDVVILDLVMPVLDGIGLLEKLSIMPQPHPSVIVLTAIGTEGMVSKAMELGADYYMVKPFEIKQLYKRICEIAKSKESNEQKSKIYKSAGVIGQMSIDEEITSIFLTIGIPAHIKGYQFLRCAVKLVIKDNTMLSSVIKRLYPGVATQYSTSPSKVERAIRHAIEVAWNRGRIQNINDIFGYNIYSKNDKPTNSEFIALVADKLKMKHAENRDLAIF